MAGAFIQNVGDAAGTGTTLLVPVNNPPTVGHTMILLTKSNQGGLVSSVTGPAGNTPHIDVETTGTNSNIAITSIPVLNSYSPGDVITINFSASAAAAAQLYEYSGLLTSSLAIDQSNSTQVTSTTSASVTLSSATTQDHELIVTGIITANSSGGFLVPSGWTERAPGSNGTNLLDLAEMTDQPSGSAPSVTWNWATSRNSGIAIASYKAAAAASSGANRALTTLGIG